MSVKYFELFEIGSDYMTVDQIIWKRYRRRAPGMIEIMMDANPQLSFVHRTTPFIPPGTLVRVPIDPDMLLGKLPPLPASYLWTDKAGMRY